MTSVIQIIGTELFAIGFLYLLGIVGWQMASKIRIPIPSVLGAVLFIGTLRVFGLGLPYFPDYAVTALQIGLGVMVGANFSGDTFKSLKEMALPAVIISTWALFITIIFGFLIAMIGPIDPVTGILSSSIGGLPEMTVLAHDTHADSVIVVLFHMVRLIITMILFPLIVKYTQSPQEKMIPAEGTAHSVVLKQSGEKLEAEDNPRHNSDKENDMNSSGGKLRHIVEVVKTFVLAGLTGTVLLSVGVPAGGLVGSLLFVVIALYFQYPLAIPDKKYLSFFLVGIGVMVSNQISMDTLVALFSGDLIYPMIVSLVLTFASAMGVAYGIHRLTGWNFTLCFLASAPAGFTVMAGVAVESGYDPAKVVTLHLARLVTLKVTIPLLFMVLY